MNDSVLLQIDSIQKYLGKKLDVATSQDEQAFIKEMSNGMIDGQIKISKTAVLVLKVLHNYEMKWQQQFADEQKKLLTETNRYKSIYQNATKNLGAGNCGKYDEAADKYMQQVNSIIRDFYTKKANEFRQWLNAFTTWNMYVSGNPKNYVMMQDIESTGYLLGIYMSAINEQVAINTVCKTLDETIPSIIPLVEIPNFTCPSVVRVPSGNDWQELTAASTSFDENTLNIKRTNQPVPNHEVSYTTGKRIGQPGIDPSSKMSNGNVSTSYMTKEERADIADANHQRARSLLETLPKDAAESRHQSNLNMIAKLPHWSEIMAIRDLFNRIMKKSCNGPAKFTKPKFKLNPGDFTFEEIGPNEVSRKRTAHGTSVEYEDGSSQLIFDDGSILEMEGPDTYTVVNEKDILQQAGDAAKNHANNTHTPLKEFKDYYDKDGFSPTLNNSMQSPDLITVIKTLFD
jgi:hypothetical protein